MSQPASIDPGTESLVLGEASTLELEPLLEQIERDYGDFMYGTQTVEEGGRTLGEMASAELFDLRHLQVGKEAPDIVGEDLEGVEFKLSDYRGKVVMLDFWGDW